MSALYVPNSWLAYIVEGLTTNITGDLFLSYFMLIIVVAVMFLVLFKLNLEWVVMSITGIILTLLAYSGEWLAFFGLIAIFFATLVAHNWIAGD